MTPNRSVTTSPDGIGIDGDKHTPVDPATPHHWYVRRPDVSQWPT